MSTVFTAANAPAALGPYSHAILTGNTLFTSGQVPLVPETGKLAGDTIEAQAEQVFRILESVLAAAEMPIANVVETAPACRWRSCPPVRRWRWSWWP